MPAFSLVYSPDVLTVILLPVYNAPLPLHLRATQSFGDMFSPNHFWRRITRPVSYYALFKGMAASKPTSWLSVRPHILLHLTCT